MKVNQHLSFCAAALLLTIQSLPCAAQSKAAQGALGKSEEGGWCESQRDCVRGLTCSANFCERKGAAKGGSKESRSPVETDPSAAFQFKVISKDTVLILRGFDYDTKCKLSKPCTVEVDGSPTASTTCGVAMNIDTGKSTMQSFCVGAKWTFQKEGLSFENEGVTYTSGVGGATVEYTTEGVLMKGMKFTPPKRK